MYTWGFSPAQRYEKNKAEVNERSKNTLKPSCPTKKGTSKTKLHQSNVSFSSETGVTRGLLLGKEQGREMDLCLFKMRRTATLSHISLLHPRVIKTYIFILKVFYYIHKHQIAADCSLDENFLVL